MFKVWWIWFQMQPWQNILIHPGSQYSINIQLNGVLITLMSFILPDLFIQLQTMVPKILNFSWNERLLVLPYDLQGRRVTNLVSGSSFLVPRTPGLYIIGSRKVLVRWKSGTWDKMKRKRHMDNGMRRFFVVTLQANHLTLKTNNAMKQYNNEKNAYRYQRFNRRKWNNNIKQEILKCTVKK